MKLRDILESSINEAKQVGDVYHATSINAAMNIVAMDFLKAKPLRYDSTAVDNVGTDKYNPENISKYISTSREKGFVPFQSKKLDIVYFQLDGNSLSNKYKTMPYTDSSEFYDGVKVRINPIVFDGMGDEKEELWYGDKINKDGGIKNIKKYIKKLIIPKYSRFRKTTIINIISVLNMQNNQDFLKYSNAEKFNFIVSWFKSNGITVEIEK